MTRINILLGWMETEGTGIEGCLRMGCSSACEPSDEGPGPENINEAKSAELNVNKCDNYFKTIL